MLATAHRRGVRPPVRAHRAWSSRSRPASAWRSPARGRTSPTELVAEADMAMYQAKRKGGAGHQIIDLREALRPTTATAWRRTCARPSPTDSSTSPTSRSCAAADGLVTGVEALLRWTHPIRGQVSRPPSLARSRSRARLISDIGAWVLERSCLDRGRWLHEHPRAPLDLAVNVSARQLVSPDFCATVAERAARDRHGPDGVDPGDDREHLHRGQRARDDSAARPQGPRHPARARRLRHRLLLAELPAPAARSTSSRSTRASSPTSVTLPRAGRSSRP